MTYIFNGKKIAQEKEKLLFSKISSDLSLSKKPMLVSFVVGENDSSLKYLELKKQAAERMGFAFKMVKLSDKTTDRIIKREIVNIGGQKDTDGIMIQLPLPDYLNNHVDEIISCIDKKKDIDGMRIDSEFIPPVVLAINEVIKEALKYRFIKNNKRQKCVVLGASGFVGSRLYKYLNNHYQDIFDIGRVDIKTQNINEICRSADVVISATGKTDLVKEDMLKNSVVLIDVGFPEGDVKKSVYDKASFVSPVPGGVGPLTIYFLMENLYRTKKN